MASADFYGCPRTGFVVDAGKPHRPTELKRQNALSGPPNEHDCCAYDYTTCLAALETLHSINIYWLPT
jgi:hypothetical protein